MTSECSNNAVNENWTAQLKARVDALYLEYIFPVLATIRVGEEPSALRAEEALLPAAEAAGVIVRRYILPADTARRDVEDLIRQINAEPLLSALLLLPLPAGWDEAALFGCVAPEKALKAAPTAELLCRVVDAAERKAK